MVPSMDAARREIQEELDRQQAALVGLACAIGHSMGAPISYADGAVVGYCSGCGHRIVVPWFRGGPTAIRARAMAMIAMRDGGSMADLAAAMSALQEDRQAIDEAVDLVSMAIAKGMDGGEGSSGEDGEAGSGSKGSFAP